MIIDVFAKTITLKFLYYGPNLSGKNSSLTALFARFNEIKNVRVIKNDIENDNDVFFEHGMITFKNQEWAINEFRVHVWTIKDNNSFFLSRELRRIDGIIFIVDSSLTALNRNIRSLNGLYSYFKNVKIPIVFAFNKQDLPLHKKFEPSEFSRTIDHSKFEAVKIIKTSVLKGEGILESFETLLEMNSKKIYRSESISKMASN